MKPKDWLVKIVPAAALLWLLFRYPREITDGVRRGLTLCGTAVIPPLFPFLVLCTFFVRSGLLWLLGIAAVIAALVAVWIGSGCACFAYRRVRRS